MLINEIGSPRLEVRMKNKLKRTGYFIPIILLLLFLIGYLPVQTAEADTASVVSIGMIDYEELTIQIFSNNNPIVYYSDDNTKWTEVEGAYDASSGAYIMDISWVSGTGDATLYFKGDVNSRIISVTIPMQNSDFLVLYDKAEECFTFTGADDSDAFEWRKTTDYNWTKVSLDDTTASYHTFLAAIEAFRVKGAKIILRLPQVTGSAVNSGSRPSKEITVTISPRASAPSVNVNSSKLTLNTTTSMEYYDPSTDTWIECSKAMPLEEISPQVLYENGAQDVALMIRTAATENAPYSKTAYLKIKGQAGAPVIGGNTDDVSYYFVNSKLVLVFNKASVTDVYEYSIVKPENDFDFSSARWTSVNNTKPLTLSSITAPSGCTVYVRKKGTDANTTKNISLVLSSAVNSFTAELKTQ